MVFPTVLFFLIFAYVPMYGVILAFKDFNYSLGIMNSPWNNFQNFRDVLGDPKFLHAFNNTLLISFGRLLIEFPIPILLAIMLNEMRHRKLKRIYQTVFTFPHFISWVVLSGIITSILSDQGVLNQILQLFGWEKNTILIHDGSFLALLFTSNIWKEAGWSSIIYLAAIAGINPELYEAAAIDGANRFQQMKAITWPVIRTTAAILLILAVGGIMNGGFDQIFNLYNPAVYERCRYSRYLRVSKRFCRLNGVRLLHNGRFAEIRHQLLVAVRSQLFCEACYEGGGPLLKRLSVSNALITLILGLCAIAAVFPFYQTLVLSLSTILDRNTGRVMLFPRSIDLSSYQYIFHARESSRWLAYIGLRDCVWHIGKSGGDVDRRLRVIQEVDAGPKLDHDLHHLYVVFFRRSYSLLFDDSESSLAE